MSRLIRLSCLATRVASICFLWWSRHWYLDHGYKLLYKLLPKKKRATRYRYIRSSAEVDRQKFQKGAYVWYESYNVKRTMAFILSSYFQRQGEEEMFLIRLSDGRLVETEQFRLTAVDTAKRRMLPRKTGL